MKIILENNDDKKSVDLYSNEGFDLISQLWTKLCTQYKLTHNITWIGVPIIQLSNDIIMMQELIWKLRPDIIIECGIAHGGSALFYASILELIGKGFVIGVDIDIRQYNKIAIKSHPLSNRVKMIEGSSISEQTVFKLETLVCSADKVMVVLDSNHSKDHVAQELELYKKFVTPGSYLVVMDGAQQYVWDIPNGKKEWKDDNPLVAINAFLGNNTNFLVDDYYTRLKVTANPKGFLKKLTQEELLEQRDNNYSRKLR